MDRLNAPMVWYFKASKHEFLTDCVPTPASGLISYHQYFGLCATPSRATGQSPFFLVYGAEAMLPSEVEFESLRFRNFKEEHYEEDRVDDLNRLEEARIATLI